MKNQLKMEKKTGSNKAKQLIVKRDSVNFKLEYLSCCFIKHISEREGGKQFYPLPETRD